jgi:ornithine carbamoyltransferase
MGIVRRATEIKRNPERFKDALHGRWLLMLFQKTSTRTRMSFEMGVAKLGGRTIVLDWDQTNFAISPIEYEARYVSQQTHLVMARLKRHQDLLDLAGHSMVPVINGCDDRFHPCQALADLQTIHEAAGTFEGKTLTYVGIHNNVSNSLAYACAKVGLHLILVTPEVNPPAHDETMLAELERSGAIERTLDLKDAAKRSHFIYTDTWVDMEHFADPAYAEEKKRRMDLLKPYQLNKANLGGATPYILHDMPIHPGYEISEDLVNDPRSLIYKQADNRMYAQQALMIHLLNHGQG